MPASKLSGVVAAVTVDWKSKQMSHLASPRLTWEPLKYAFTAPGVRGCDVFSNRVRYGHFRPCHVTQCMSLIPQHPCQVMAFSVHFLRGFLQPYLCIIYICALCALPNSWLSWKFKSWLNRILAQSQTAYVCNSKQCALITRSSIYPLSLKGQLYFLRLCPLYVFSQD